MQLPFPDDWDGESTCRWAVCWPDSPKWLAILSGLLEMPAQGRFWDFKTGNFLELRQSFLPIYLYNFTLKECIMACGDNGLGEVAAALRAISVSINNQATAQAACCGSGTGSAGQGKIAPPYNPTEVIDPGTGEPPAGFESWEQYFSNKCDVATYIVQTLLDDVRRMGLINLVGLTVVSLIPILLGLILTPIPGDEIAFIGGLLLTTLTVGAGMLDNMADQIEASFSDLVCALYNASSSENAETAIETAFNDAWDNGSFAGAPWGFSAKAAFGAMVTSAVTNRLFTLNTELELPSGDCSACQCILAEWVFESDDEGFDYSSNSFCYDTPSTSGSSAAWSGGVVEVTAPHVGNPNASNIAKTGLSIPVTEGMLLVVGARRIVDNNNFCRLDILFETAGCQQIATGGFLYTDQTTYVSGSLDTWVDDTILGIGMYFNNTINQEVDLALEYVAIRCDIPE